MTAMRGEETGGGAGVFMCVVYSRGGYMAEGAV